MSKLNDCLARLKIAQGRLRWYEDAFALIRQVLSENDNYESCSALLEIEKIVGGPVEQVGE